MSLQFYFGASGSGKSRMLHTNIIQESIRHPEQNFFLIVPDQFTMQTQMDLVTEHPDHAIMNIDVLSFGRLTHRILEETGAENVPVLDDTGKSLVLRKVAQREKERLHVLGGHLHKIGYIHEVKSALSEFMQYGIGSQELAELTEYARERGALYWKLQDLGVLYSAFLEYIQEKYITTEETLDRLCTVLPRSALIRGSVVAFDGFTGFTPVQYRVIRELLCLTAKVILTVTIDERENPYHLDAEQKLFHLSQKTVADIQRIAQQSGITEDACIFCKDRLQGRLPRFRDNEELAHLERELFRYPAAAYQGKPERLHLAAASTPQEEVRQTCIAICRLLEQSAQQDGGALHFRDIAVVTGSMEVYGRLLEEEFQKFRIPLYLDHTRGILGTSFATYIRSALQVILQDFSYESVFHYLRSGLADFERDEIDRLENYVRRFGIRGRKRWSTLFVNREESRSGEDRDTQNLMAYNEMRERLLRELAPLFDVGETVGERVRGLYDLLVQNRLQQKLAAYQSFFEQQGDLLRAKEYSQLYALVIDLLDQINSLLAEETMDAREFAEILDAGLAEITVGTIPQNVDRVVAGDIERTRLKQVRILFFLGINDGNIPKACGNGGIISDIDREFLQQSSMELAPTPRQQMYIQRLYLYLNMTKPSERLYLSYALVGNDGKSLRPAYLIGLVQKLFPDLTVDAPEREGAALQLVSRADGMDFLAGYLREYAAGRLDAEQLTELYTFYHSYLGDEGSRREVESLVDAAFYRYRDQRLSGAVTRALYGSVLLGSVSRLERYAACAYAHFLQYGLLLRERSAYSFEDVDMGNVFHGVLEIFSRRLGERGYTWFDFPQEEVSGMLGEALEEYAADYEHSILYSSARNQYLLKRIMRILNRTVLTLQKQLRKGTFAPEKFEMSFSVLEDLDALNIALSEQEKMRLRGRIDRIDTCEEEDRVYVKVIDYKSGSRKFDLAALYYGLQLQLVVYMNAAMEAEQKKHPGKEIVPAAMLYYHVADPMIENGESMTEEELNRAILKELKMTGMVNADEKTVSLLDGEFTGKSEILPIERKKDGSYTAASGVLTAEDLKLVSDYADYKIREIGRGILDGNIAVSPCEQGSVRACTYCAYKSICSFDERMDGYQMRKLPGLDAEEALQQMKETLPDRQRTERE